MRHTLRSSGTGSQENWGPPLILKVTKPEGSQESGEQKETWVAGVTKKKVICLFSHMLSFHLHCTTQFWTHYVPSATVSLSTRLWLGVEVLERNVQPAGDL